MKILIDADACPVVDITVKIAQFFNLQTFIFCDTAHRIQKEGAQTVVVPQGNDSVDFVLLTQVEKNDIVITQDYGLASMVLSKEAHAINQDGLIYNKFNIETLLFSRHISKKLRNAGKRTKGPKKRTKDEDYHFQNNLESLIKKYK